jgi:hypothetical protein
MSVHINDHWIWLAYPVEVALVDALVALRIHGYTIPVPMNFPCRN